MKTKMICIATLILLTGTIHAIAGSKKEEIRVSGNCDMCKKTIETASKSVDGVHTAEWNKQTKILTVHFDEEKTSSHKIQKAISDAGYDTEKFRASEEAYKKLPSCCRYDRSTTRSEEGNE